MAYPTCAGTKAPAGGPARRTCNRARTLRRKDCLPPVPSGESSASTISRAPPGSSLPWVSSPVLESRERNRRPYDGRHRLPGPSRRIPRSAPAHPRGMRAMVTRATDALVPPTSASMRTSPRVMCVGLVWAISMVGVSSVTRTNTALGSADTAGPVDSIVPVDPSWRDAIGECDDDEVCGGRADVPCGADVYFADGLACFTDPDIEESRILRTACRR